MNFKVIHEIAGRVFAGGGMGIAEIDPETGEILAQSDNGLHHWDVTLLGDGTPAGIVLDQRNGPGLRVYDGDLGDSYVVQPPVEGKTGRIASDGSRDYWLAGVDGSTSKETGRDDQKRSGCPQKARGRHTPQPHRKAVEIDLLRPHGGGYPDPK